MNITTGACLRDVIDLLQAEGFENAEAHRIRHAIVAGHISRPPLNGSLKSVFSRRHINQLRRYLGNVPRPGRKPQVA